MKAANTSEKKEETRCLVQRVKPCLNRHIDARAICVRLVNRDNRLIPTNN